MERGEPGVFEWMVLAVACLGVAVVVSVWSGAWLALAVSGHPQRISLSVAADAAARLPANMAHPARAWGSRFASSMPGAPLYWTCTVLAAAAWCAVVVLVVRLAIRSRVGTAKRRPLGVDGRTRFATRRDLRPLLVSAPTSGRFVLATFRRRLVATEASPDPNARRSRRGLRARRGDRGAVALVGPSRSGKTTAAVAGILEWDGPAVLSSVKADLLATTLGWRSGIGDVRVYDPTGSTSVDGSRRAQWSPLNQASTVDGAQRAARALCDAVPRGGVEGGMDFWLAQAEILLTALLFIARHVHRDMSAVCDWVLTQDRPGPLGPGEVRDALDALLNSTEPAVAHAAVEVSKALASVWELDDRTRSSIYATTQTLIWPWTDPGVAASARTRGHGAAGDGSVGVDLAWLMSGANTVYLCSPIEDQRRLAPAFGGLLNDLINQAYRHVAATGQPLDPPLLVVIDEAGNTPLRSLPEYASTLAGLGVLLVTIWQSLAQLEVSYGKAADTILTNHLTKLFYAGLSDRSSLRYVEQVLGDTEVNTRSRSTSDRTSGGSVQVSTVRLPLAPAHVLRQMRPGDALLIHGTLPPAHVKTRPFYRNPHLAARAAQTIDNGATR